MRRWRHHNSCAPRQSSVRRLQPDYAAFGPAFVVLTESEHATAGLRAAEGATPIRRILQRLAASDPCRAADAVGTLIIMSKSSTSRNASSRAAAPQHPLPDIPPHPRASDGLNASLPDASLPDASLPDASLPDASPPAVTASGTASANFDPSSSREALIATAAYYRAEKRGFAPGHETEDWLAAEREVDGFGSDLAL